MSFQVSFESYSAVKDLVLYFKNRANYIKRLDDNYSILEAEIVNLRSRKGQIDCDIQMSAAIKDPTAEYNNLGERIVELEKRYSALQSKYQKLQGDAATQSSVNNVVGALQVKKPTLWTRKFYTLATLSKHITRLHDCISQLNHNLDNKYMMREKMRENVQVKSGDTFDLPQQARYVDKILIYLNCPGVKRISILGTAGVGKTTILETLNNRLKGDESRIVIWVNFPTNTETENNIIEAIQDEIILKLKISTYKTDNIDVKSDWISKFLTQKYLFLMDEVSANINLHRVGIHSVQVVVAARDRLSINNMKMDREVEIDRLPNEDAWMLLEYICGTVREERIKEIGYMIIRCCGGLPVVIKSVAWHLKKEIDEQFWRSVKRQLQSDHIRDIFGLGGVGKVYQMMYDQLEEDCKKCLLYGALFPDEHKIYKDYLFECWKAEGFFSDKDSVANLRAAREDGVWVLKELTDKHFLKSCSDKYLEMPILFKKVALAQNFPGEQDSKMWVSRPGHEFPTEESWSKNTRMSLIGLLAHKLPIEGTSQSAARWLNLPDCPECNNISTLLLQLNPGLQNLGDFFFQNMKNLLVLDLHKTEISSLPSSISFLKNLVSLYVNECSRLMMLPPEVQDLLKLEILDIRKTSINPWLPRQIGRLGSLKCLRVSFSHNENAVVIMYLYEVICNLKNLEELIIETAQHSEIWINAAKEIAKALASLEHLTTLQFDFPTVNCLQALARSRSYNFAFFKIFVGCGKVSHPFDLDISGTLAAKHLTLSSTSQDTHSHVPEILKQASTFELIGHSSAMCLNEFEFGNMGSLKVCVVGHCNTIQSIVDANKISEMNSCLLQCLEKLLLYSLSSLEHIWKGSFLPGSFSSLIVLKVYDCPELTEIVPEILMLLEEITVIRCNKLIKLSMTRENAKKLVSIECETSWWRRLELPEKEEFEKICSFI